MKNNKIKCDFCKTNYRIRNVIRFKGKYICSRCKNKNKSYIINYKLPMGKDLDKVLNKVYEIKAVFRKNGKYLSGYCYFPKILIGNKFKIELID